MYGYYPLVGLLVLVLDCLAIASVVSGRSSVERKVLWTLAILILPIVGMLLYFMFGRSNQDTLLLDR